LLPSELRIGYEGRGQIDADDTSFWPALGHGEGKHTGATPHMEQLGFARHRNTATASSPLGKLLALFYMPVTPLTTESLAFQMARTVAVRSASRALNAETYNAASTVKFQIILAPLRRAVPQPSLHRFAAAQEP
jgi:hypothetical protein